MNRSEQATIARGIDSASAEALRRQGWTIAKLQQAGRQTLEGLSLSEDVIAQLYHGARPPIPRDTLTRLLFRNRFTCCVCRDSGKPIIVHHIAPWAESRDHGESNLAVLCLDDHEKAHRTSTLAKNLDAEALHAFKHAWEALCARADRRVILSASRLNYDAWLYFNHLRLFELARAYGIKLKQAFGYRDAKALKLVDGSGNLLPRPASSNWMYSGGEGMTLYHYVHSVFEAVLERVAVRNFSDFLDRGIAYGLLEAGDFILVHGAHIFKIEEDRKAGPGQTMLGRRRANNVEVRFIFDRWEATSNSAWGDWLLGRQSAASLVQVKQVFREEGNVVIAGTVFAIGHFLKGLQQRSYSRRYSGFMVDDEDEDEDDGFGDPWFEDGD